MKGARCCRNAAFAALLSVAVGSAWAEQTTAPQRELRPMLKITWSRGPDLPQGFQDSDGGFIGNMLITACGFCSGEKSAAKLDKYR